MDDDCSQKASISEPKEKIKHEIPRRNVEKVTFSALVLFKRCKLVENKTKTPDTKNHRNRLDGNK